MAEVETILQSTSREEASELTFAGGKTKAPQENDMKLSSEIEEEELSPEEKEEKRRSIVRFKKEGNPELPEEEEHKWERRGDCYYYETPIPITEPGALTQLFNKYAGFIFELLDLDKNGEIKGSQEVNMSEVLAANGANHAGQSQDNTNAIAQGANHQGKSDLDSAREEAAEAGEGLSGNISEMSDSSGAVSSPPNTPTVAVESGREGR